VLRSWSFNGYGEPTPRPAAVDIPVLTPPSIVAALQAGYLPAELRQAPVTTP
jgi:hypothetical protein